MKRILIVCDYFFPSTSIGAVRPSKITKMLINHGYSVDVFTRYQVKTGTLNFGANIFGFKNAEKDNSIRNNHIQTERTGIKRFLFDNFTTIYNFLYKIKAAMLANKSNKEMVSAFKNFVAKNDSDYDVIFSTFGPLSSLLCGLYYKKTHPDTKWICDFRDPAVVSQVGPVRRFFLRFKEQQACKLADEIVAVSNGYIDRICGEKYKEKRHMIPNGYDKADLVYNDMVSDEYDFLSLVYVGILYGQMRDVTPIFEALKELSVEGKIDLNKVKFNYAGIDYVNLKKQADIFEMSDIIINHGVLPRCECLKLQFSSDLLVLSTWNTKKEYGVFPGKLLEYMLIRKPIVTTVSGDVPYSEVAQVVKEGNLGIVYEEINRTKDLKSLKSYLESAYNHKLKDRFIPFEPNQAVLDRYCYESIVSQIESIIEK